MKQATMLELPIGLWALKHIVDVGFADFSPTTRHQRIDIVAIKVRNSMMTDLTQTITIHMQKMAGPKIEWSRKVRRST